MKVDEEDKVGKVEWRLERNTRIEYSRIVYA